MRQANGQGRAIKPQQGKGHDVNGSIYRPDEVPDGWILPDLRRYDVASSARSFLLPHATHAHIHVRPRQHKQVKKGSQDMHARDQPRPNGSQLQGAEAGGGGVERAAKATASVLLLWPRGLGNIPAGMHSWSRQGRQVRQAAGRQAASQILYCPSHLPRLN